MNNPYESPRNTLSFRHGLKRIAGFEVGVNERHTVEVFWTSWGDELYTVDGEEVFRLRRFAFQAVHRFTVGIEEKHDVEIRLQVKSLFGGLWDPEAWVAQAYVDGELAVADLMVDWRRDLQRQVRPIVTLMAAPGIIGIHFGIEVLRHDR